MTKKVVLDSDAVIALILEDDVSHEKSIKIMNFITKNDWEVIIPVSTILESATVLSRRYNRTDLAQKCMQDMLCFYKAPAKERAVLEKLITLFEHNTSGKDTPFDYYIYALALAEDVEYIFSFDKFYNKVGLKLAAEIPNQ
jgi:predicted nucleic acid-binding protein